MSQGYETVVEWVLEKLRDHTRGHVKIAKADAEHDGIDLDLVHGKKPNELLKSHEVYVLPYHERGYVEFILEKPLTKEQEKVESGLDHKWLWDKEKTAWILDCIREGDNIILNGPAGCGKSTLLEKIAEREKQTIVRINLHFETDSSSLLGEKVVDVEPVDLQHIDNILKKTNGKIDPATLAALGALSGGNTVTKWQYAAALLCWKMGWWLQLDEMDFGQPEHLSVIQRLAEVDSPEFILSENGAERISRHSSYRMMATSNSLGVTSNPELYVGALPLNEAFLDRFILIQMYYHPEESKILHEMKLESGLVKKCMELANNVRILADQKCELATTFSTRKLVTLGKKLLRWKVKDAIEVVVLSKLRPDVRGKVEELCTRIFPEYTKTTT